MTSAKVAGRALSLNRPIPQNSLAGVARLSNVLHVGSGRDPDALLQVGLADLEEGALRLSNGLQN